MPSRKSGDGYKDVCFPITKEAREYIEAAVLTKFEESGDLDYDAVKDVADEELPF
jgi:DNA-binding cell septation regulator SpoVG